MRSAILLIQGWGAAPTRQATGDRTMTVKKTTKNGITLYWSETLKAWVTIPED